MVAIPITYTTITPSNTGNEFNITIRPHGSNIIIAQANTNGEPEDILKAEKRMLASADIKAAGIEELNSIKIIEKIEDYANAKKLGAKNLQSSMSIPLAVAEVTHSPDSDKIMVSVRQCDSNKKLQLVTIDANDNNIEQTIKRLSNSEPVKALTDSFPTNEIVNEVKALQSKLSATPASTMGGGEIKAVAAVQHERGSIG